MDYYTAHVIARLEHEQRIRSLKSIAEYGFPQVATRRLRLWQMPQRWLRLLGSRLIAVAKRMLHEPATSTGDSQQHGREAQA